MSCVAVCTVSASRLNYVDLRILHATQRQNSGYLPGQCAYVTALLFHSTLSREREEAELKCDALLGPGAVLRGAMGHPHASPQSEVWPTLPPQVDVLEPPLIRPMYIRQ